MNPPQSIVPSDISPWKVGHSVDRPSRPTTLRWYWLVLLWLAAALIMASHRPACLLYAQFWAEDGHIWYQQAYEQGPFEPFTHSQDGYFQTLPRLIADVALLVPLHRAPLVMNILALLVQTLPVLFLLSPRGENWGTLRVRSMLALLYLCLPNSAEWHANTTNSQWTLALLAVMVLLAKPSERWLGRVADLAVLSLSGLTGPFCLLLVPVAIGMAWLRRQRWRLVYCLLVVGLAAFQGYSIFAMRHVTRMHQPLGASVGLFIRILAAHIFAGSVLGTFPLLGIPTLPFFIPLTIVIVALAVVVAALWRGPLELKLFTLFAAEVMAAALKTPIVSSTRPQWPALLALLNGRYYMFPMLAFVLCAGWVAWHEPAKWLRGIAITILCAMPIGVIHNWHDFGHQGLFMRYRYAFPAEARSFETAPRGTRMIFPLEPSDAWFMTLTRH